MTKILRTLTDSRFTTKGSALTLEERDQNWIEFEDDLVALAQSISQTAGGASFGIQQVTGSDSWNGESPVIEVNNIAGEACTITIPTANITPGVRITILDTTGNANTDNIIISCGSGEEIDGGASYTITQNFGSVMLQAVNGDGNSPVSTTFVVIAQKNT